MPRPLRYDKHTVRHTVFLHPDIGAELERRALEAGLSEGQIIDALLANGEEGRRRVGTSDVLKVAMKIAEQDRGSKRVEQRETAERAVVEHVGGTVKPVRHVVEGEGVTARCSRCGIMRINAKAWARTCAGGQG